MADRGRRARARRPGRSAAPSESAGRHGSSAELGAVGVRLRAAHVLADADDHAAGRRAGLAGPEFLGPFTLATLGNAGLYAVLAGLTLLGVKRLRWLLALPAAGVAGLRYRVWST